MNWCVLLVTGLAVWPFEIRAQEMETFWDFDEQPVLSDEQTEDDVLEEGALGLEMYLRHPVNLNGNEKNLEVFPLISSLQRASLIRHRDRFGDLVSVYELQAVPGFTVSDIRKLLPYIATVPTPTIRDYTPVSAKGQHEGMIRLATTMEALSSRHRDSTWDQKTSGRPVSVLSRYRYLLQERWQAGFTLEKDAGERLGATHFPFIMDFHSFYLHITMKRRLNAVVVGDYQVKLGQGLIHWQGSSFMNIAGSLGIYRQARQISPYRATGEFQFFRGVAVTTARKKWEWSVFGSSRKLSANQAEGEKGSVITSFVTSGLHRTEAEREKKNSVRYKAGGGSAQYRFASGRSLSANFIMHNYSLPIEKKSALYNYYTMVGKNWWNYSLDMRWRIQNWNCFGELAVDRRGNKAFIAGSLVSLSDLVDLALQVRNFSPGYQAVNGQSHAAGTLPTNEKGGYAGIYMRLSAVWQCEAFAELYRFPWLRYRVDASSAGHRYGGQVTYQPSKKTAIMIRWRMRMMMQNNTEAIINYPEESRQNNFRLQVSTPMGKTVSIRQRVEICRIKRTEGGTPEWGYLLFQDILYKRLFSPFSLGFRWQYFETEGYDTRIYAFENDLHQYTGIPAFYDTGMRLYLFFRVRCRIGKERLLLWSGKLARTIYQGKTMIGSGLSAIHGNHKTDLRLQVNAYF